MNKQLKTSFIFKSKCVLSDVTSDNFFSESPTNGEKSCAPLIARKVTWQDVAAALTSVVLAHPGGPYNNTPLGRGIPSRAKVSGCFKGHSTAWISKLETMRCFYELNIIRSKI